MFSKLRFCGLFLAGFLGLLPAVANASNTFTVTPPTFDLTSLGAYVTAIVGALAAIWLARKFIKLTNKS